MGPILTGLFGAGLSLLGAGGNAALQGSMNRKTRKWNENMYAWQRRDALTDWNMQNEYNSPAAQMDRYKAAGLNPNLIYGQTNEAPSVRSTSMDSWKPDAPRVETGGITQSLMAIYDLVAKQAQTNNLNAQAEVAREEKALKMAQTAGVIQATEGSAFDLSQRKRLSDTQADLALANLRNLETNTMISLHRDEREAMSNAQSLQEGMERVLTLRLGRLKTQDERDEIRARIELIKTDTRLKILDENLRKAGINPSDPVWMRVLGQLITGYIDGSKNLDVQEKKLEQAAIDDWKPYQPKNK